MNHKSSSSPFLTSDPPHWAARGLSYLLMLIFVSLVAAAVLIDIPETISAPFVLAQRLGTDPVRALRHGIIQQVDLVEGQTVKQGETLFIIRSEQTGDQSADLRSLENQLRAANEGLRLASEKYRSQQLAAVEERRRLQGQIEHLDRMTGLKNDELKMASEVAESYDQLRREGLAGGTIVKDKQTEVSRLNGQLEQIKNDQRDARAALEKIGNDEELQQNEHHERERILREEIEKTKILISTRGQWVSQNQGNQITVTAPCSGTILRLHVKAKATIINAGETLLELSCSQEKLHAELQIPQNGVGRIKVGQGVKLLYESFPYQQFGVKFASLRWISPTTSTTDFRAIAEIEEESINVLGQPTPLKAGMGGRAEVVIAKRSVLSIALDPIRQLRENMASPPEPAASRTSVTEKKGTP